MNAVGEALAPVCPRIERELKPHLRGLFAGMVRSYLPQQWTFTTELGSATLSVDQSGNASVVDGANRTVDVSIAWTQAQLEWAVVQEGRGPRPTGSNPEIHTHTGKGKTAFGFLRGRFKL